MEKNNKKIVMFDFDGVLVDTLIHSYTITQETNENLSIEEYKTFFNGNIHDASRKNNQSVKYDPEFHQKYRHLVREIKIPDVLKQGIVELAQFYMLVIVSSTLSESIKEILVREGIEGSFEDILGADIHPSKVFKIKTVLEKYTATPDDCVFVTDTLGDIQEATECDVRTIAVTWGFQERENLEKGNPLAIIDDPSALADTIKNMVK